MHLNLSPLQEEMLCQIVFMRVCELYNRTNHPPKTMQDELNDKEIELLQDVLRQIHGKIEYGNN